ncbi:response regulator transcription factor [Cellulophaga baltica]|uniref:response regulator transcription factor n=1 Tax=Cellulophaga TaxID=104264 RepID=UPI001C0721F4|nr:MULTISPECIES: response regulator transcription factor [Cellulophaga]MBU2995227.1 response regulator transcription factor [Cellulophaga baltica]MDO6766622.1 response regulator transcription factor [Cellulophaga sp. 1_MG-2023]
MKQSKNKILLVDDDEDILEILEYNLVKEGFNVHIAKNGKLAIEEAKSIMPDLIVLDVMMPGIDGVETCEQLRSIYNLRNTLIVFFSARNEMYTQLAGFDAGADDYITKPIKPKLIVAKIKALLRRQSIENFEEVSFDINGLTINRDEYSVIAEGTKIILPKKEFELLALLASSPNKIFKRKEILNKVWKDNEVSSRTVDVHITKLRKKIGESHLKTMTGVGYKFETV